MKVLPIKAADAYPWLLDKHYARRLCPISFAFGAFRDGEMIGVVTYGVPASAPLRAGICGPDWQVYELNRLICQSGGNIASQLIGLSLKQLPKPAVIVSYADTERGHIGYVYQATNFIYTGLSAKRTDWKVKGREHLHGATIADESRGIKDRAAWMRAKYGDDFYLQDRPRKHRYVYFVGSRSEKKRMRAALNYEICSYPKGNSERYDDSARIETQGVLEL